MADNTNQLLTFRIGMVLRDLEPSLDLTVFNDVQALTTYLNKKHGTNLYTGQPFSDSLKELENTLCKKKFNRAMPV